MTEGNANDARAYGEGTGPNPKLRSLDRLVGTWEKPDPGEARAVDGYSIFEWMEDGHFRPTR